MHIAFILIIINICMLFKTAKGFNINILDYKPLVGKFIKDLRSLNYVSYDIMDDLYQEGMIGLIKAQEKFDPSRNVSFGHYCKPWVKHRIFDYYYEQRTNGIREPKHARMKRRAYQKDWQELWESNKITDIDIIKQMKISRKTFNIITRPQSQITYIEDKYLDIYYDTENTFEFT